MVKIIDGYSILLEIFFSRFPLSENLSLNIDDLLKKNCNWVGGYLLHNPNVNESNKALFNLIITNN
jgi:hypothetical protein